ncbi:Uncharacterised protein [Vibrio cholerae]|nr:Uncharacterised protein [Vibrio cholerae]
MILVDLNIVQVGHQQTHADQDPDKRDDGTITKQMRFGLMVADRGMLA